MARDFKGGDKDRDDLSLMWIPREPKSWICNFIFLLSGDLFFFRCSFGGEAGGLEMLLSAVADRVSTLRMF